MAHRSDRPLTFLTNFSTFDTSSCVRVVPIFPPGWMVEVDDAIAVIGDNSVVEGQRPDPAPILKGASLAQLRARGNAFVGHFD